MPVINESLHTRRKASGKWLAETCRDAGYRTQEEAAEAMGFSRVQVARWMAGMSKPKEENMPCIARALSRVASEYDVYDRMGHTPPATAEAPDEGTKLARIIQRVPPEKRPSFIRAVEAMAEMAA